MSAPPIVCVCYVVLSSLLFYNASCASCHSLLFLLFLKRRWGERRSLLESADYVVGCCYQLSWLGGVCGISGAGNRI